MELTSSFTFQALGAWRRLPSDVPLRMSAEYDVIRVFEENRPKVAFISKTSNVFSPMTLELQEVNSQTGSGFVWDAQHVVTNNHVVGDSTSLRVTLIVDGNRLEYKASVRGRDPGKDIAVLRLEEATSVPAVRLGNSSNLSVGQTAIAIGNPFGLDHSCSRGIVAGLGRSITARGEQSGLYNMIQTDAAINPGNSGGPLLDSSGQVIGMNTAIFSLSGAFSGIGFAIPSDTLSAVCKILIKEGRVKRVGTGINFVGADQAKALGVRSGVVVLSVTPGSAASLAGLRGLERQGGLFSPLQLGDVIVEIEGRPINTEGDYLAALDGRSVGEVLSITIMRRPFTQQSWTSGTVEAKRVEVNLQLKG